MVRIKKDTFDGERPDYRSPIRITDEFWAPNPDSFAFSLNNPADPPKCRRVPSKHRPFRTGALCP